jgi:putative transposase
MVDENADAVIETEVTAPPVASPEPKKQRATRRTPAEMAADAAAKSARAGGKKSIATVKETKATLVNATTPGKAVKGSVKPKGSVQPAPATIAPPAAAGDEMADLMRLEEENKSLRKELSDKLRAENADLRKRLGQA